MKKIKKRFLHININKLGVVNFDKILSTKGKYSVRDISNAIEKQMHKNKKDDYSYVEELYPTNYPNGTVVVYVVGGIYKQYDYTYKDGTATLSKDFIEVKNIFTQKKKEVKENEAINFEITSNKFDTNSHINQEDFYVGKRLIKKGEELHYILGVVLEPEVVDLTQTEKSIGDIYNEDEVRKAAHEFMRSYNGSGNDFMHDGNDRDDLTIVESYIAPVDFEINNQPVKKGTWLMSTLVLNEKIWGNIKKGEITGYSIGGYSSAKFESTQVV